MSSVIPVNIEVGYRVRFFGDRQFFTVQACDDRYVICTRPYNLGHTVLYTIVDLKQKVRGTENLVFGLGFETRKQCETALDRLNGRATNLDLTTEVSYRNRVRLDITDVRRPKS